MKARVYGPYRVIRINDPIYGDEDMFEVVEMIADGSGLPLRPRKVYAVRQSAYAQCARLNRHWQADNLVYHNTSKEG